MSFGPAATNIRQFVAHAVNDLIQKAAATTGPGRNAKFFVLRRREQMDDSADSSVGQSRVVNGEKESWAF
jgi:hypothetical protein